MPISFTNHEDEPPVAETVESLSKEESEEDDESQISASDFEGDLDKVPIRMMFGPEECGAIFSLSLIHIGRLPTKRVGVVVVDGVDDEGSIRSAVGRRLRMCIRDSFGTEGPGVGSMCLAAKFGEDTVVRGND